MSGASSGADRGRRTRGIAILAEARFTRELVLGEGLDTDNLQASYDAGVLHVTIPLTQQAQPRKVQIGRGEGRHPIIEAGGEGE
jgi:HSP20 family protein